MVWMHHSSITRVWHCGLRCLCISHTLNLTNSLLRLTTGPWQSSGLSWCFVHIARVACRPRRDSRTRWRTGSTASPMDAWRGRCASPLLTVHARPRDCSGFIDGISSIIPSFAWESQTGGKGTDELRSDEEEEKGRREWGKGGRWFSLVRLRWGRLTRISLSHHSSTSYIVLSPGRSWLCCQPTEDARRSRVADHRDQVCIVD